MAETPNNLAMEISSQTSVRTAVISAQGSPQHEKLQPGWFRIVMPSATDIIFLVLLLALTYGGLQPRLLGDAGTGWHIRNGQHMLQSRSISRQDYFSYTMSGQPWFAWEWLCDLAMGAIFNLGGLNGIVFVSAVLIATLFALVFRMTLIRSGQVIIAALLTLLAIMASSIHMLARPHLVSWLFTFVFWYILERSVIAKNPRHRFKLLAILPVLMLPWVNIHGAFLLGLALIAIYFAGQLCEWLIARHNPNEQSDLFAANARGLAITEAISAVLTLINPYGYKLWVHLHEYLGSRFYMDNVQEFLSPNFHGAAEKCFGALILLTLTALALNHGRVRATQLLLVLFSLYTGLYAARNIPVSSMLLVLISAPLFGDALQRATSDEELAPHARSLVARLGGFSKRMAHTEQKFRGHLLPAAAVVLTAWICLHGGRLGEKQVVTAQFSSKRFPVHAVDFLATQGIRSHVFNPDLWGGYLIYRLYPEYRVFMDDRHDFYGESFVRDYMKIRAIQPGWEEALNKYKVNWVLIRADSTLSNALKEIPAWKVIYDDGMAIIFARTVPLST